MDSGQIVKGDKFILWGLRCHGFHGGEARREESRSKVLCRH